MDQVTVRGLSRDGDAVRHVQARAVRPAPTTVVRTPPPRFSWSAAILGAMAMLCLAGAAWPYLPRIYQAQATLVLRPTDNEGQETALRQPLDESAILSELDVLSSPELVSELIRRHGLADDPEFAPPPVVYPDFLTSRLPARWLEQKPLTADDIRRRVQDHIKIARDRRSYTVSVGIRSKDPVKAAALVQSLVGAYTQAQIARKREAAETLTKLLESRTTVLRTRSEESREVLTQFMAESGLMDHGAQVSLEAQLSALSTEAATARARAIEATARYEALAAMKNAGTLDSAPEVLASPTIQRFKQSLAEASARPAVMGNESRAINEQLAAEQERILNGIRSEASTWSRREALLQSELTAIRNRLTERRTAEMTVDHLRREAASDEAALTQAEARLMANTSATIALRPDVEVIAPARVPGQPAFPSLPLYGAGALAMAMALGLALNARAVARSLKGLLAA